MSVLDERLVHLRASGLLRQVRGIVFGQLSIDRSEEDEFEDFMLDLVSDLDVPVLTDFPAGHEVPNITVPLGTEVELVADEGTGWVAYAEEALEERGSRKQEAGTAREVAVTAQAGLQTTVIPAQAGIHVNDTEPGFPLARE
jgi:hypothetical protein